VAALVRIAVDGVEVAFDVDGARLVPTDLGWDERPVVVLVGEDAHNRDGVGPALARVAQVVYVDSPGSADELLVFLDALEIERPVVLGGSTAFDFASQHPERAAKVVLVGRDAAGEIGCPVLAFAGADDLRAATDEVVAFVLEPELEPEP
jgi:pimeloyl-ACP methyl ester carboxylesterase